MKKMLVSAIVVILVSLLAVVPAFAKTTVVKGEVTAMDPAALPPTLTVLTSQGETLNIVLPAEFEMPTLAVGDTVLIRSKTGAEGEPVVESIKILSTDSDEEAEGSKANSAYCDPEKQDKPHPFAVKIAAKAAEFGFVEVDEEWVMERFCDGVGMGQIMLAVKTSAKVEGKLPDDLLTQRKEGSGWGKIWQELKLVGSEKSTEVPVGELKRTEHGKPNK
jgi:hypothetical protein